MPIPKSSTPALLLITVRFFVPRACSAAISVSGMPQSPNPPIMMVAPSGIPATASDAPASTLFIASHSNKMHIPVHPDLEHVISFHESIVAEGGKALVDYDTANSLANVVLMSEIPTSYDKKENRQVHTVHHLPPALHGLGKTVFSGILAD